MCICLLKLREKINILRMLLLMLLLLLSFCSWMLKQPRRETTWSYWIGEIILKNLSVFSNISLRTSCWERLYNCRWMHCWRYSTCTWLINLLFLVRRLCCRSSSKMTTWWCNTASDKTSEYLYAVHILRAYNLSYKLWSLIKNF